ncbi:MAG: SDR family NAD(P)-dependent oxidoreductase [Cryobacterium sp.]
MFWNPRRLPGRPGKTFVVTGANAGLGYFTSEQLASTGAHVVLACRNAARAEIAATRIRERVPGASVSTLRLDVADAVDVQHAVDVLGRLPQLHALILNAGIVHPPVDRCVTLDGSELVLATNYLGHVQLTEGLLPVLGRTPGSRVVSLGSVISRIMDSSLDDLQLEGAYSGWKAYAQSKIASQVYGFDLDRRLRERGQGGPAGIESLVVHPGYSISGLTPGIPGVNDVRPRKRVLDGLQLLVGAQGKHRGAYPTVRAVLDRTLSGGDYLGPRFLVRGAPVRQPATRTSRDPDVARRLRQRTALLLPESP